MAIRATLNTEDRMIKGIETVAKNVVNDASLDKTLKGIIIEVPNENSKNQNEYKVKIQNAIFSAYSSERKYTKNTEVYILIPNGDMSQTKTILSKVNELKDEDVNYLASYEKKFSPFLDKFDPLVKSIKLPSIEKRGDWKGRYITELNEEKEIKKVKYYLYSEDKGDYDYPLKVNQKNGGDDIAFLGGIAITKIMMAEIELEITIDKNISMDEDFCLKDYGFEIAYSMPNDKKEYLYISLNDFFGNPYKKVNQNFIFHFDNLTAGHLASFDVVDVLFYTELPNTTFSIKKFNLTPAIKKES